MATAVQPSGSQRALHHGAGLFSALVVKRAASNVSGDVFRSAIARLFDDSGPDRNPHILIGVRPEVVGVAPVDLLPRQTEKLRFPSTQAHLLVQVAADSREQMLAALRRVDAITGHTARTEEELLGGRIGLGREPFGFRDGLIAPTSEEVDAVALVRQGPLAGAAWVLYLRFEQDLSRFAALSENAKERVFGITREGQAKVAGAASHVSIARESSSRWPLIRRGFPYRKDAVEGLAFVAVAADPENFRMALDAMLNAPDPLLRYATAVAGGLYLAPPSANWLRSFAGAGR